MIHVDFNNVKDEIDEFVSQDPDNIGNGNNSSSIRYLKFISFFVNNRLGHFEQLTTTMKMIQVNVDDTKPDNIVSIPFGWKIEYNLKKKVREAKRK